MAQQTRRYLMFKEWLACVAEYEMQLQAMLDIVEDMEGLSSRLDEIDDVSELTAKEQEDALHAITDMMYLQRKVLEKLKKLGLV